MNETESSEKQAVIFIQILRATVVRQSESFDLNGC